MAYVIVSLVNGLKYYVQHYRGEFRLNGLLDNAVMYGEEDQARSHIKAMEYLFDRELMIEEVLPKTEN